MIENPYLLEGCDIEFLGSISAWEVSLPPIYQTWKLHYCYNLEDLSCLDGIHNLTFHDCSKIRNISYRISIRHCRGIATYSVSFRSSRSVMIDLAPLSDPLFEIVVH